MIKKIKLFFSITGLLMILACSDNVSDLPKYKITEDTVKGNIKRTVEVELPSRTDEETLMTLAEKIHSLSNVDVERTFIGYRIYGDHKNQSYWATTHYNPDLEINILGESISDYVKIKNSALPEGELLGTWMANWGYEYKMTAYKKGDQTFIRSTFGDGTYSDEIYEQSQAEKGIKLQSESGKEKSEYFIINQEGNLDFWSENSNYYTAIKS